MHPPPEPAAALPAFRTAVARLREAVETGIRTGFVLDEVPAPTRLAPHAVAVAARVERDGAQLGTGRFVVLHDPDGQDGWHGTTRIVAFVSCEVDDEMAADPALGQVGWSWLTDALADRGARYTSSGGTVTRTVSTRFGQLRDPADAGEVEIRASWTAVPDAGGAIDLVAHLQAWCELLAAAAGLPPPGVTALPTS